MSNKPYGKYSATNTSLALAKQIADKLGHTFDDIEVATQVGNLHEQYFNEIRQALNIDSHTLEFLAGNYRLTNAFAGFNSAGNSMVGFDELFDFWLVDLTHLTMIAACEPLSWEAYQELVHVLAARMNVRIDPYAHEETRDLSKPFFLNYADLLFQISHPFSKAMIAFIICHEIAHCVLGHLDGPASVEKELEADTQAIEYFLKLIDAGSKLETIRVDGKLASAPLVLIAFFDLSDRRTAYLTGCPLQYIDHPTPATRLENIQPYLSSRLVNEAHHLYDGLFRTIDDFSGQLIKAQEPNT